MGSAGSGEIGVTAPPNGLTIDIAGPFSQTVTGTLKAGTLPENSASLSVRYGFCENNLPGSSLPCERLPASQVTQQAKDEGNIHQTELQWK